MNKILIFFESSFKEDLKVRDEDRWPDEEIQDWLREGNTERNREK